MRNQLILQDARYDWSQVDLARHSQVAWRAVDLLAAVRGHLAELEAVLGQFGRASERTDARLTYAREPGALAWHLALEGPSYRAKGTVELTLETSCCVAIIAHPEGNAPLRYEAYLSEDEGEFAAVLIRQFRAAVVSSVLDAPNVIHP